MGKPIPLGKEYRVKKIMNANLEMSGVDGNENYQAREKEWSKLVGSQ